VQSFSAVLIIKVSAQINSIDDCFHALVVSFLRSGVSYALKIEAGIQFVR